MHRLADRAPQAATSLRNQMGEQRAEHLTRAARIGIGKRRARYRARAEMVEPVRMTGEPGFNLAQALRAGQLPVQKCDELIPGRQPAHPRVGPVRFHQPIKCLPRHVLQDRVKYAILMPHGVDLLPCPKTLPDVRKTEESTPCALSNKTQPDSRACGQEMTEAGRWRCARHKYNRNPNDLLKLLAAVKG